MSYDTYLVDSLAGDELPVAAQRPAHPRHRLRPHLGVLVPEKLQTFRLMTT